MSDTSSKRNSVAAKVATPKPSAPSSASPSTPTSSSSLPMQDPLDGLRMALGARIQVRTVHPDSKTHEGVLYTADPTLNIIAINCTPAPPNPSSSLSSQPGNYHIIPIKHILNFQVLSLPTTDDAGAAAGGDADYDWSVGNMNAPPINKVDLKRLKEREDKAVQKQKDEEKKKGKGVSLEAQELFNVLDKMYSNQTRWAGESIILMDSVRIDPPYTSDDVRAPKDKQNMLPHLKKVVEGERRKIAARTQGAGTPPVGPRKGG